MTVRAIRKLTLKVISEVSSLRAEYALWCFRAYLKGSMLIVGACALSLFVVDKRSSLIFCIVSLFYAGALWLGYVMFLIRLEQWPLGFARIDAEQIIKYIYKNRNEWSLRKHN
jgi:hypothetical protein